MESRTRIENVRELQIQHPGLSGRTPEDATLAGFLDEVALYTDLDSS